MNDENVTAGSCLVATILLAAGITIGFTIGALGALFLGWR